MDAQINPKEVFGGFEKAKDFLNETTQQVKEALAATTGKAVNTITIATDKAVDTASATARSSLEQTLQKADQVLEMVGSVSPTLRSPIILFTYYNPILNRGIEPFLQQLNRAGVAGLVVPDLPLEEAEGLLKPAAEYGIDLTLLIAPTSSAERISAIARQSQGFIYLVSVTGVTGIRSGVEARVQDLLQQLRQVTDKPIGVGFGISQLEHARQVKDWGADAVIVGSAFVKRLADGTPEQGLQAIADFCKSLKAAITTT